MNTLLIDKKGKKILVNSKKDVNTQYGIIRAQELNKGVGKIKTHLGYEFLAVKPSVLEMVENMGMGSRPIYPYDSGIICAFLNIMPGKLVLEAGTGSGGLTLFMAELGAKITTYEKEERFYKIAEKNLKKYRNVKCIFGDVIKTKEKNFDAIVLDLQNPAKIVEKLHPKLKFGGFLGVYSPIMDDIKPVWTTMSKNFTDIRAIQLDIKELMVKKYGRVKGLLGFPGFFIWGRKVK